MCSKGTSSPHFEQYRWYLIRPKSSSWSWLKRRVFSSVAGYRPTGIDTKPKLMAPFHMVLGISRTFRERSGAGRRTPRLPPDLSFYPGVPTGQAILAPQLSDVGSPSPVGHAAIVVPHPEQNSTAIEA